MYRALLCVLLVALPVGAADFPAPAPTSAEEPVAATYSAEKAAAYLDGVGVNWTRDRKCITCHTNLPYLMARPHLPGDAGWAEVRAFLAEEAAQWARGVKPRSNAAVVATATGLAVTDAARGRLSEATRQAFQTMWALQKPTGEWNWIKCDWPPLEHDDYYGVVLAAVALGTAPEGYAATAAAQPGRAKLRAYLTKTPAPDLHHRTMLLWAATKLPELMSEADQKATIAELRAKQHADGGWALPALGHYARRDKTPNDPAAPSDGYATGFVVYVLRQAGVPASDPDLTQAVHWLKSNQRESGRWYTRSLNNDKAHYITNAGTAYAVLALSACGSPVPSK